MDEQNTQSETEQGRVKVHEYSPEKEERRGNGEQPSQEQGRGLARSYEQQESTSQGVGPAVVVAKTSLESGSMAFGPVAQMVLAWQREVSEFLSMRLDKNVQFAQIQRDYLHDIISDYTSGVQRLMSCSLGAAWQSGERIAQGAEKAA